MNVSFSIAGVEPVTIELIDASGRVAIGRTLAAPAPGRQNLELGSAASVRPGVYFLRITQGARSLSRKATIIR